MVEAQIYFPKHTPTWENIASVTGPIIIVQTNILHRRKVSKAGQAMVNHE